jgi:hypothetical protein
MHGLDTYRKLNDQAAKPAPQPAAPVQPQK